MDDLRAHRRLSVDFDAFVTATGLRDVPCKVRDFCLGGALLSFDDPLRPTPPGLSLLERGMAVRLRVMTRSSGRQETYTFVATVARRDAQTLGVAFTNPDPTALMALQSLANTNSTQQRRAGRPDLRRARFDEVTVRKAVGALRDQVRECLADLPAGLISEAEKSINGLAREAANNEEHNRLIESITTLRRYAANIQSGFLKQALKPLEDLGNWQPGALLPGGNTSSSKLSLIDRHAFEDWLAVKVMVSRAEADCKESLFELQIRLNEMFGLQLGVQNNPVGPAVFYHALGEPIQKLKLPKPVEHLLLKLLENNMIERLGRMYPLLNEILIKHGVLPELEVGKYARVEPYGSPRPAKAAESAAPAAIVATAAVTTAAAAVTVPPAVVLPATAAQPAASVVSAQATATGGDRAALAVRQFELQQKIARQSYATVQRLLAARQAAASATSAGMPGANGTGVSAPRWEEAVVTGALDNLQRQPESAASAPLRSRLQQVLDPAGSAGKSLPTNQSVAADTVDELFGEMLATPLLRDDTKSLIRQLDVPFLKLLLTDNDFFGNEQHPARQVLNRLAALGARGAMTTPQQQQKMAEVVNTVTASFDRDISVFRDALQVLEQMIEQQRKVYQHNLQRVRQASEGQHRVAAAQRKVRQEIEARISGRRVPRALLTLLDSGWRESLVSTLLRHGPASAAWHEQIGVIDQMARGIEDPAALNMKALLALIKKGLAAQATGQINRDAVVGDLREMFTALSGGRPEAVPAVDVPVGAVDPEAQITMVDIEGLGRWLKRAREIAVGDWIEFAAEDGEEVQRARLAWRDEDSTQFVFVNLQGMKLLDLDVDSIARSLREEKIRRIEDPEIPLVDRGLEAMVQKVYGQLAHRATHDELTGLFNRREFEKRLLALVSQLKSGDTPWTICWLDLDQFKIINSTCGFEAGNALIVQVAEAIAAHGGTDARIARLGGDEFAILARSESEEPGKRVIDRILLAIDALRFAWEGKTFPIAASAGVVFIEAGVTTGADLMKAAEAACYAAKEGGRNRVHVFRAGDAQLTRRDDIIKWVSRLNQAIENDRLQLRCQRIEPVVPNSGLLPHYEILIAIEDENGEFIPPSSFMQAAESYNRMHAVDHWVIQNTLQWMHNNPQRMANISGFSINLSGQSMNDEKLTRYILQQVLDSDVAREKVTFEVTETAAIANLADAADFIREMQAIGCKFSLDDFGSGLSSYSYLKNLPVDFVKIDGAFVRDMHRNAADYMMVRSINEMAHFMGKQTIAEYVENDEILAKLREIGVDFAQGYGIERPKPLDSL